MATYKIYTTLPNSTHYDLRMTKPRMPSANEMLSILRWTSIRSEIVVEHFDADGHLRTIQRFTREKLNARHADELALRAKYAAARRPA